MSLKYLVAISSAIICSLLFSACTDLNEDKIDNPYPFVKLENIQKIKYGGDDNSMYRPISISPDDRWLVYQSAPGGKLIAYNLEWKKNFSVVSRETGMGEILWKDQEGPQEFQLNYFTSVQLPDEIDKRVILHKLSNDELVNMEDIFTYTSDLGKSSGIYKSFAIVGGKVRVDLENSEYIMFDPDQSKNKVPLLNIVYGKYSTQTLLKSIKAKKLSSKMYSNNIGVGTWESGMKAAPNMKFIAASVMFEHSHFLGAMHSPSGVSTSSLYLIDLNKMKAFKIDNNFGVFYSPGNALWSVHPIVFNKASNRLFYITNNEIKCLKLDN